MMPKPDLRAKQMDDLATHLVERIVRNAVKLIFDRHGEDLELIGVLEFQVMQECVDAATGGNLGPGEHSKEESMKVDLYALRQTFEDLFKYLSDRLAAYEKIDVDILNLTLPKPIIFNSDLVDAADLIGVLNPKGTK